MLAGKTIAMPNSCNAHTFVSKLRPGKIGTDNPGCVFLDIQSPIPLSSTVAHHRLAGEIERQDLRERGGAHKRQDLQSRGRVRRRVRRTLPRGCQGQSRRPQRTIVLGNGWHGRQGRQWLDVGYLHRTMSHMMVEEPRGYLSAPQAWSWPSTFH